MVEGVLGGFAERAWLVVVDSSRATVGQEPYYGIVAPMALIPIRAGDHAKCPVLEDLCVDVDLSGHAMYEAVPLALRYTDDR